MVKKPNKAVGTGVLTDGRMAWDDAPAFTHELRELGNGGVVITAKLATAAEIRSEKANRYYWGVVLATIVAWLNDGTTAEDIHDAMCELHLPNEAKRVEFFNRTTGEQLTVDIDHRRSSKLKGKPFYDFVEKVREWAYGFFPGITIADPDPEYWKKAA